MYTPAMSSSRNKDTLNEIRKNVIFRYFSSEDGVFRISPGIIMPKTYNPMHRPWYIQARALLNDVISEKVCILIYLLKVYSIPGLHPIWAMILRRIPVLSGLGTGTAGCR